MDDKYEHQMQELLNKLGELFEAIKDSNGSNGSSIDPDEDFDEDLDIIDHIESTLIQEKAEHFLNALDVINFPGGAIQYARITELIFKEGKVFDGVDIVVEEIKMTIENHYQERVVGETELSKKFYKILDHIKLANYQFGEISYHTVNKANELKLELFASKQELMSVKSELENSKKGFMDVTTQFNASKSELIEMQDTIQDELTKIYVQFITILSIFTAVVVSIFGGLSMISTSFTNLKDLKLWEVTLTISLFAIAVLCMLSLLTGWVSTIVFKLFDKGYKHSFKNYITHNGAFTTGIFIFSYIAILSAVFNSDSFRKKILDYVDVGGSFPIIILLSLPLLAGVGIFIKSIDFRTFKK